MQAYPRTRQAAHIQPPSREHPATTRPILPIVPLTRESLLFLVLVVTHPTQAWHRVYHLLPADQSTARVIIIHTRPLNITICSRTSQNQLRLRKPGLVREMIKTGSRCSHGHRAVMIWVGMTGTVGMPRLCRRMAGPIRADRREFPRPAPRGRQLPTTVSRPLLRHSIPLRAVPGRVSRRLLFSLFRFRLSRMALSHRRRETFQCQGDHTHPCNNHSVPVCLLLLSRINHSRELLLPFPPVNPCLLTLTHSLPTCLPPLVQRENLRRRGTCQEIDRTSRRRTVLSS